MKAKNRRIDRPTVQPHRYTVVDDVTGEILLVTDDYIEAAACAAGVVPRTP